IYDLGIPILGICYGMHVSCLALGNEVSPGNSREFGRTPCHVVEAEDLFRDVPADFTVWMSHGDQVKNLSDQWIALASTDDCRAGSIRLWWPPCCRGPSARSFRASSSTTASCDRGKMKPFARVSASTFVPICTSSTPASDFSTR